MTFTVDELEDGARVATGLDDFGRPTIARDWSAPSTR